MTDPDDAARMAAGIRAIEANARALAHDKIGTGAPPPPEITNRPGHANKRLAETVKCLFCGAEPGSRCTHRSPYRGAVRPLEAGFHRSRLERAQAAAAAAPATPPGGS